mmetsp:Transcript_5247/g.12357  ORF Transcript_5247/g.12357 Transcript_5247/m.12357 type:complete len:234 (+) Transcript_5247:209-910(+)
MRCVRRRKVGRWRQAGRRFPWFVSTTKTVGLRRAVRPRRRRRLWLELVLVLVLALVGAPSSCRLCRSAVPPPTDAHLPRRPCQREFVRPSAKTPCLRPRRPPAGPHLLCSTPTAQLMCSARWSRLRALLSHSSRRTTTTTRRRLCRSRQSTSTPRSQLHRRCVLPSWLRHRQVGPMGRMSTQHQSQALSTRRSRVHSFRSRRQPNQPHRRRRCCPTHPSRPRHQQPRPCIVHI